MKKSIGVALTVLVIIGVFLTIILGKKLQDDKGIIKVGILHSLSGPISVSAAPVVDATLLAIKEINKKGGVLGKKIVPIVKDGKSNWDVFAEEAEKLIVQEQVAVVFGCWTSASRKTVRPIFEKYNHLLIYPLQYEGVEDSPNILYTGATPNQQIIPAVKWVMDNLGKKFFLIGSDYVFPHVANEIIKIQVQALKGTIVGEEYIPLDSFDFQPVIDKILEAKPDVIFNTINGYLNKNFFSGLQKAGITAETIPTVSFSIAEEELRMMAEPKELVGNYTVWNYFQSIDSPENREFVEAFKKEYGNDRVTDDPIEAAYIGVYLWAQAVNEAKATDVSAVRNALRYQRFNAPEGWVYVDPSNQHIWKTVRVGKVNSDMQFTIVWSSEKPIKPIPYPVLKTKREWETFVNNLQQTWGGSWSNTQK